MVDDYADRWALITGASSGIGAEFARALAARGMHLVLAARRRERLEQLASELHTRHGTRSEVIPADLSQPDEAARLMDHVTSQGIQVELLINNAGFAVVGEAHHADLDRIMEMIRLNIGSTVKLTYLVLPGMMEREHGAVVNVASVAGFQPVAYMPAYAASKAYVMHFSEGLWAEARQHGVTVMALCPGVTRTEFFDVAGVSGWLKKHRSQSTDQVVKTALKALEKRRQYVVCGWANYLLSLAVRLATRRRAVLESMKYFRPQPEKDESSADAPQDEGSSTESGAA